MLRGFKPVRIAEGPAKMVSGEAIRRAHLNRDAWPFPHVYPPVNSKRRTPSGAILAPNTGAANAATILQFNVPTGFWFFMNQLGLYYQGEAAGPGSFLFTVNKNTPQGGILQGVPLTDWQNIPFQFGSFVNGPLELPRTELFAPEDQIRAVVNNVSVGPGGTNFFGAYFGGWLIPVTDLPEAQ